MEEKKSNKGLVSAIIVALVILTILFIFGILGIIINTKLLTSIIGKTRVTNYSVDELHAYVPSSWEERDGFKISPSGNCKIIGGTTYYSQSKMEEEYTNEEIEHKSIIINGIDVSYGYKNTGYEKIHSYYIEHNNNNYSIIFINKVDSDQECNSYLDKFEESLTLKDELEEENL